MMKKIHNFIFTLGCILSFFLCMSTTSLLAQLQPEAIKEINLLSAEKNSRTATEIKLSSQLLQTYRESQGKPMVEGVTLEKVALTTDNAGNILVDINAEVDDVLLSKMNALGIRIVSSSVKYHGIRAYVAPTQLLKLAGLKGINFVKAGFKPHLHIDKDASNAKDGTYNSNQSNRNRIPFAIRAERVKNYIRQMMGGTTDSTGTVSEGNHTMKVDSAKAKYGYTGQGMKIGVLSDNYNSLGGAATDVKNGELPGVGNPYGFTTPVTVVQDDSTAGGTDEGRAMLQIVHDLVPDAKLYFATADDGDAGFASNIEKLANAPNNCNVIVDDAGYYDEPAFQDGSISLGVNYVTKKGVLYFSSAGNGGSLKYDYASVWEGDFVGTTSTMTAFAGKQVHNFGTTTTPIIGDSIITTSGDYTLKWADPLGKSTNDYDLYLISKSGGKVIASSTNVQNGNQDPYEEISTNKDKANYMLVIVQNTGAQNRALRLDCNLDGQGKGFVHTTNGGTCGHPAADSAIGVAASDASIAYPNTFTTASQVENFSSDGPRRIFYTPDTIAITPGNFLFGTSGGTLLGKPNLTGADGVSTNVSGAGTSFTPFYGTSSAAPHCASVAILLKSAKPTLTAAQIKNLLFTTAIDIEAPGFDYNSGHGIVNALAAMDALFASQITSFSPVQGTFGTVVTIKGKGFLTSTINGRVFTGATSVTFGGKPTLSFTVVNDSTITAVVGHGDSGSVTVVTGLGSPSLAGFTYIVSYVNITLNVDVTNYLKAGNTIGANGIRVTGDFTSEGDTALPNYLPSSPNAGLTNTTGNIWSIKVTFPDSSIGGNLVYKFANNDASKEEGTDLSSALVSGGCGFSDANGNVYRTLPIPTKDSSVSYCWDQCSTCNLSATVPTLVTNVPTNIAGGAATIGGNLSATGGSTVTKEGVVYSTYPNPTTQNSLYQSTATPALGNFSYSQTGLLPNTTYYVRAFAVNSIGTVYGIQYSFTTLPVSVAPTIISFTPTSAGSGTTVTIKGKNLTGASSVSFGGVASPYFTVVNDSTITAVVGTGATGSVSVTNTIGTASLAGFTFVKSLPNIAGNYAVVGYFFHPTQPRALNLTKTITLTGTNTYQTQLGDLGTSNYNFQFQLDSNYSFSNWTNAGSATPAAPASGFMTADNPGKTAYTVTPLPGQSPYLQATYNNTYVPSTRTLYMHYGYGVGSANQNGYTRQVYETWVSTDTILPSISSITPTSGTSGTAILIKGSGFSTVSNTYTGVTFGSQNAANEADSIVVISDSVMIAYVGNGETGSVFVTNASGTASIGGFRYIPLPVVTKTGWVNVGPSGFTSGTALNTTVAIGTNNVPYTAYIDSATSRVFVMKFINNAWSNVGSAVSAGKATNLSLVLDNTNSPIVAYIDSTNGGAFTVEKYTSGIWSSLGSAVLTSVANYVSFAIDTNNVPYVFNGNGVYSLNNSTWTSVGTASFATPQFSYNLTIDKTTNTPYVVFDSTDAKGLPQVKVEKYTGSTWVNVGKSIFSTASNGAYYLDIAVDKTGTPLVSFQDDNGFERASVYKYTNGSWGAFGSPRFTNGHSYTPSFVVDKKNNPLLLFNDFTYDGEGTVLSATDTSNWATIGTRGFAPGINYSRHALAIDTNNAPYIVFYDQTQGGKATVLRYLQEYTIAGNIKNPLGEIIPSVSVSVNGTLALVDTLGSYTLTLPADSNYTIVPSKNNDIVKANGVTVADVSLIQSDIFKRTIFNSPYKFIAADVNNDGLVNVTDIGQIQGLILGHITTFNGRLWAFVDSSYVFANPTNPFPYKDSITITDLNTNFTGKSFVGVKLGDVNYDWNPDILGINKPQQITLFFNNITQNTSSTEVRVPIRVKNFNDILGMQYTLDFNNKVLSFKGIENNTLATNYCTDFIKDGKISFLWVDPANEAKTLADSTVLFDLVFDKKASLVDEDISLTSDITAIYAIDGKYNQVGIIKEKGSISDATNLLTSGSDSWSVSPNPSKDGIIKVSLSLAKAKTIQFELTTSDGRTILQQVYNAPQGNSSFILNLQNRNNLSSGTYYLHGVGLDNKQTKILSVIK
jgi:hypothetical protein